MACRTFLAALAGVASLCAGGCGIMPAAGPESWDVRAGQTNPASLSYALVSLTPEVERTLGAAEPRIAGQFTDRRGPSDIRFGIGDVASVTIFESAAGGLFIPLEAGTRPGNFITLPNQSVDSNGNISIPYAGSIHAAGRTAVEIQKAIIDALKS